MTTFDPDTAASLSKARGLLMILLATCHQTLLALEAAANALDSGLAEDLSAMIERSEKELRVIDAKLAALRSE